MNRLTNNSLYLLPLLLAPMLSLAACLDEEEKCIDEGVRVFSISVLDDDSSVGSVTYLEVETNNTGLDVSTIEGPWAGQSQLALPMRLAPVMATPSGASVTVTAYDSNATALGSATGTLPWNDDLRCTTSPTAHGVPELELD